MEKCVYCGKPATTTDALELPACSEHEGEANTYIEQALNRNPNEDTFTHCNEHSDMWEPGCLRCETCCQYHYGMTVQEFLDSPASRQWQIHSFDNAKEMLAFLREVQR